ncbi:MAG TPA: AlpA family transcriptional regulator [Steroidobacteraceae bacterium]|nr:AlpA family transcriptional regulator [Steroidobacteraceae bacterium]
MNFLRLRQVVSVTGLSRMTIGRLERAGEFPRRRQLGARSVAWVQSEVEEWIESRPTISGGRACRPSVVS